MMNTSTPMPIRNAPIVASMFSVCPARFGGIGVAPAGHAANAQLVHRPERQVEADEEQREVPPPRGGVQHPAGPLGEPVDRTRRRAGRPPRRSARSAGGRRRRRCRAPAGRPTPTRASRRSARRS